MASSNPRDVVRVAGSALALMLVLATGALAADAHEVIRIAVGHAEVIPSSDAVRTVAIAEPTIADAAVGSERSVIVNAKAAGSTSLVVYGEGGRYKVYDIDVFVPNQRKQVLLHVKVAEVSTDAIRELGIDWMAAGHTNNKLIDGSLSGGVFNPKLTNSISPFVVDRSTDIVLTYIRNDGNLQFQTAMKALEEKGDIRLLASPSLLAMSGEKASFLSGGEFAYQVISGSGAGSAPAIQFKEFGVKLDFTPYIEEDGTIRLKVAPEVSEPDFTRSVFGVPPLNSRKASTTVNLRAGEYLAIGGLRDTRGNKLQRKVPILGYIPLVGALFSYSRNEKTDKELVVVVSPEIIEPTTKMPSLPTDQPQR